jgi:hypothetical protein
MLDLTPEGLGLLKVCDMLRDINQI